MNSIPFPPVQQAVRIYRYLHADLPIWRRMLTVAAVAAAGVEIVSNT